MDAEFLKLIGASFGAVQAIAQLGMLIFPQKTVAWRVFKYLTSGPQRPAGGVPAV